MKILEIAKKHKWNLTGIVCSLVMTLIGLGQMDMMFWSLISYEDACKRIWVPELGISLKDSFELFWMSIFLSILLMLISCITWKKGK